MTSILNQFVRMLLLDVEGYFLNANFVSICQRILWQSLCFRRFTRYHGWLSRADLDNLCYWSQGFFIRKFLTVDFLTVRTIDTSLDGSFALDTWSCNLAGITNQFIRFFFTNAKVDFFYARFICICQWIFWQSVCFRCFIRYYGWFSRSDFDDLCYGRQSFLIGQLLAVDNLAVRTVDSSLNRALTLNTWSCNLMSISNKLIRFFFTNCEVNFLNPSFVNIS